MEKVTSYLYYPLCSGLRLLSQDVLVCKDYNTLAVTLKKYNTSLPKSLKKLDNSSCSFNINSLRSFESKIRLGREMSNNFYLIC